MNLSDLIDQAGTKNCKAGRGEKLTNERIEEIWWKCRNCSFPDYEIWQKNCTKTERNLAMMNNVSEEPRVWGLNACGLISQNDMYWNCEEEQWKRYNNGVKHTELSFCKPQVVSLWGESLRSCFVTHSAKNTVAGMGLGTGKVWWWMMIFWFPRIFVFLVNCFAHVMNNLWQEKRINFLV